MFLPAHLQRSNNLLQLLQHRIGRRLEGRQVVLQSLQVAGITGQHQGDEHEVFLVQATLDVLLDGLAEADGQLLARIHGDALRGIGHEGIGQSLVDDGTDELVGVQHTRVGHYRHRLDIAYFLDERAQVLILHLCRDKCVAQHATVDAHGRVQRVQARRHLHRLHLVDRFAGGIERTTQVQRRTTVGVVVLYHQILCLLGIHEGSGKGVLLRLDVFVVLEAVLGQQFLHLLVRTRRNLINHRPGEGHQCLITNIVGKALRHQSVVHPSLGVCQHAGLDAIAIMRTVVHRLHGNRQTAGLIAFIQQGRHLAQREDWL